MLFMVRILNERGFFFVSSFGVFLQASSGWWDVFSHLIEFVDEDPLFNPAHIGLYAGVLLLLIGVFRLAGRSCRIFGLSLLRLFVILQLASGVANEIVHRISYLEAMLDFYVHSLFTLGMLLASIILFVSVSLHYSFKGHVVMLLAISMAGSALWLVSSGSILYLFHQNVMFASFMLGFIISIILNTATASTMRPGIATLIMLIQSFTLYLVLVAYVGVSPYPPLGLVPVILVEAIITLLAMKTKLMKTSLLIGGVLYGVSTRIIYYPLLESIWRGVELYVWSSIGGLLGTIPILLLGEHISNLYIKRILSVKQ